MAQTELINIGAKLLVGTDQDAIVRSEEQALRADPRGRTNYSDGRAAGSVDERLWRSVCPRE